MKETDSGMRNLGMDLVRATEGAAVSAARWMGFGKTDEPDLAAIETMHAVLDGLDIDGHIVVGEEKKTGTHSGLDTGSRLGTGQGPALDVVLDPIDGRNLVAQGSNDAISVLGVAPRGSMWVPPADALYMDKIVVDREAAGSLVPECMDAPAAWTLALVARVKKKRVGDLVVFVLDRPRHQGLIEEIRQAGARVLLRSDGDIAGALMAAFPEASVDLLMGIGGVAEGVISACAVEALGGAMLVRLAPQSKEERQAVAAAGLDTERILGCHDLVSSREIFFAATGITDGVLLSGVRYRGDSAETESLILRAETGSRRLIRAEHRLECRQKDGKE